MSSPYSGGMVTPLERDFRGIDWQKIDQMHDYNHSVPGLAVADPKLGVRLIHSTNIYLPTA